MHKLFSHYSLLLILIALSAFFYLYNLNWGSPHYFHPDERNVASSVSQLRFPQQMNPHFFAYGSLPIYTIFFLGFLHQFVTTCHLNMANCTVTFELAVIISRVLSAFFAILLIPILFILGTKLKNKTTGYIAAALCVTSVGFIQFAHFGTFEMWLTLFSVLLFLSSLLIVQRQKQSYVIYAGLFLGILIAIKVSSLALLPLPLLALFFSALHHEGSWHKKIFLFIRNIIGILSLAALVYTLTNPFVFLDTKAFLGSMQYESSVALGTLPVFYTGEFFKTLPIFFHFTHVYPFLLNPVITVLFVFSFIYLMFSTVKNRTPFVSHNSLFILLLVSFLLLFLSQAFLFVKWVRYLVPTLPFVYLITALGLSSFTKNALATRLVCVILLLICVLFSTSYFITSFVEQDSREAAASWAKNNIPGEAHILSEVYDMGIVPFNASFPYITLYNFYELDNKNPEITLSKLLADLPEYEYIILPSQRLLKTRVLKKDMFKNGAIFYQSLINGSLGYKTIYQTPCNIFCLIVYLGNPLYRYEGTASVFDKPIVVIFQNTRNK